MVGRRSSRCAMVRSGGRSEMSKMEIMDDGV